MFVTTAFVQTPSTMSHTAAETGRVQSIKSKFENLSSLDSLDISAPATATIPNKYRKPSAAKFLFKRSSTSIDLPINRISVTNNNNNNSSNKNNNNNNHKSNDKNGSSNKTKILNFIEKSSPVLSAAAGNQTTNTYLRRHNNLDRTSSADTFAVKKRNLIANNEDTIKPLKEIKENVEIRLARHTNDPIKRSSIKRSPAFRVGDKSGSSSNSNNNSGGGGGSNSNSSKNSFKTVKNENSLNGGNKVAQNATASTTATAIATAAATVAIARSHTPSPVPPPVPSTSSENFAEKFENFLKRCDTQTNQDLQESGLTDTLKAFLRQPLPTGPPPKKPPRSFIDAPPPPPTKQQVQKRSIDRQTPTPPLPPSLMTMTTSNNAENRMNNSSNSTHHHQQQQQQQQLQRRSPVHSIRSPSPSSSIGMKQKIDLLENQLVLKANTNHRRKSSNGKSAAAAATTKDKNPFSASFLNCIPCSSASIYDTMTIGQNQFGRNASSAAAAAATAAAAAAAVAASKEPSPDKITTTTTITSKLNPTLSLQHHRPPASRSNSEPIYMEPFAHLKLQHNSGVTVMNGGTNNHLNGKHQHHIGGGGGGGLSPTSGGSHLCIEPKQQQQQQSMSSSMSNGSIDGPESLGSSLTSCTSCTADSITDLHDIHYMCTSIENRVKSSDSDSISNENDPPAAITLSNTYDEINNLVNAAFGQHKSPDTMSNTIDLFQASASIAVASTSLSSASSSSMSHHNSSITNNDAQQQRPPTTTKLSRTLTEKRKDYVRRVSAVKQINNNTDLSNDSLHQTFKPSVFRTFSIDNTDDSINHNSSSNNNNNDSINSTSSSTSRYGGKRSINNVVDRNESVAGGDDLRSDDNDTNAVAAAAADIDDVDNCKITADDHAATVTTDAPKLFQVCLLIGFNNSTRQPYIKSKFPADEDIPPNIEQLVFPSPNLINQTTRKNQDYSIILTDNDGNHVYGYCRRVLPESCEICLPLAYCLISEIKAPGFYFKILKEIETRHGQAEFQTNFLLQNLQTRSIPAAGKWLHIKLPLSPRPKTIATTHHKAAMPKRLSLEVNPKWLTESAAQAAFSNCEMPASNSTGGSSGGGDTTGGATTTSNSSKKDRSSPKSLLQEFEEKKQLSNGAPFDLSLINRSLFNGGHGKSDEIFIRRPNDLRLESTELSDLYQTLGPDLLIIVFSSLLLERKVILYTENISILSSCVLGLQTLLYPFQWQHTIITILPDALVDICQAPIPVLAGLLEPITFDIEDGIVIDLDHKTLVQKCGDETTILPSSLSHSLKVSLEMVDLLDQGKMLSSVLIAEAFLRCFVELFVGYKYTYFDKKLFIESHSSQSYRLFLEWFIETAMFRHFVHQKYSTAGAGQRDNSSSNSSGSGSGSGWSAESKFYDLFESRILKSKNESTSASTQQNMELIMKNCKVINKKAKTFKDRFKEFIGNNNSN